jgi:ATP-binding cassette, subfamily F, member 3
MLLSANITNKTIGAKPLLVGLHLTIQQGEKVALIGRNGVGKTTLFRMLAGEDPQFDGEIQMRRGTSVIMTAQEHTEHHNESCLEYIVGSLPEYTKLKHIIDEYPASMGRDMAKISAYTDALNRFGELGYHDIEEKVISALAGGQKRFVELVKVTQAQADLALIDEPTNHMDYVAKAAFIDWLGSAPGTVIVITHDRDVLHHVNRIMELKDHGATSFDGDYDAYLKQNSVATVTQIGQYEIAQRTLENLHKQIMSARAKKASSTTTPNPFIPLERRLQRQYDELKARMVRPSFWVDQKSVAQLDRKVVAKYDRYKDRNIHLRNLDAGQSYRKLLVVQNLSLAYDEPLFSDVSFDLAPGERLQIRGRNGAGKTTLIKAVRAALGDGQSPARVLTGEITHDPKLKLGVYEQEPDARYMKMTLGEAVMDVYHKHDVTVNEQKVRQVLADYLFDPTVNYRLTIDRLSGGQRARFQLISMLCHQPNLLILDEPTNHLDLPSIEELEKALGNYTGAVLYVSHDSYFDKALGGRVIQLGPV